MWVPSGNLEWHEWFVPAIVGAGAQMKPSWEFYVMSDPRERLSRLHLQLVPFISLRT
jgi:hypothetical protein